MEDNVNVAQADVTQTTNPSLIPRERRVGAAHVRQTLDIMYTDTSHASFFSCTVHVFNESHYLAQDEPLNVSV